MKDYRAFKRYEIDEWEDCNEWKGSRLDFLWTLRDYDFQTYMALELNEEKEDMYSINDNEVGRIASNLHYSVDMQSYDKQYRDVKLRDKHSLYKKLIKMKQSDIKDFLLKSNCNLYEYLSIRYAQTEAFYELEQMEEL